MRFFVLILKGVLFGIANLIPGVSGGTMAVLTGVYTELLDSINSLFKSFKKSISFLIPYAIGIILSVLLASKLITFCLDKFPIPTMLLFVGLISGGIPSLVQPVRKSFTVENVCIGLIALAALLLFIFFPVANQEKVTLQAYDYIILFVSGFFASVAMVIPGISGMLILMLFGYYDILMGTLSSLLDFSKFVENLFVMLPLGIGILIGLFTSCRLFSLFLRKYPKQSQFVIIGCVTASIICVLFKTQFYEFKLLQIIIAILMIPIGFFVSYFLGKISDKTEKKPKEVDQKSPET